ncbi:putative anti-sigma regulatory factor, serine/threonine protein kinase [Rippkaea orientalis PCC 8801]|uniref:Putative anti-sigma regulatory factor, serine/threonine protein kinase n=1 Tax=Rippkaea orientalis (strain PCC 8801 / RF-1) TaxID=41431 RepID=B7JUS8_RIPO1|nr:ATP-binding protein [Rippkaea orientalis]ACK65622.1 putative anti-sigma regulatory factor, serine/threonine protein kinase [Rippkaea orientalis PCC 8801]
MKRVTSQSLLKQFRLNVKTELEALEEILPWFEEITQGYLPQKVLWECKLALAEGFTNTVRYAHQDLPPVVPIILEVHVFSNYLEMRIWDVGPAFDLARKLLDIEHSQVNPLEKESARGLFFMKHLTDDLQYIRIANRRNCLMMKKNLE